MRITEITLKNYRAFYGCHTLKLDNAGKNLMVYGENGSGKSSLFQALKDFFLASVQPVPMQQRENIFVLPADRGTAQVSVKVKERADSSATVNYDLTMAQPQLQGNDAIHIANANKIKAFFDYRSLLKTHLMHQGGVNLFKILIDEILVHAQNRFALREVKELWDDICRNVWEVRQGPHVVAYIEAHLSQFNNGLKEILTAIESDANRYLKYFFPTLTVSFDFGGVTYHGRRDLRDQQAILKIQYCGRSIPNHQFFLNEARLSALAISLYLASIKANPSEGALKVVVLDDILIGLDMSNRLPLLGILKDHFADTYQIIMTTYDRVWFELVKNYFGEQQWKYVEIYTQKLKDEEFEIPLVVEAGGYLDKAQTYLDAKDYKASAVYVRSEFERIVKWICEKKNLRVIYKKKQKELKSDDFWASIKDSTDIDPTLVADIETHRATVMNPFSHDEIDNPQFEQELQHTIDAVQRLKDAKGQIRKENSVSGLKQKLAQESEKVTGKEQIIQQLRQTIQELQGTSGSIPSNPLSTDTPTQDS